MMQLRFVVLLYVLLLAADALAGDRGAASLSRRARGLLRQKMKTLSAGAASNVQHRGRREARTSGCPYASRLEVSRSDESLARSERQVELAGLFEETSRQLTAGPQRFETQEESVRALEDVNISNLCESPAISCDATYPYRTADGSCNNLANPDWGSTDSCMRRILPADYADGLSQPRVARNGDPLPNARKVSFTVHPEVNVPDTRWTHLAMQFGQFLDHDITLATTPGNLTLGPPGQECCDPSKRTSPECYPIDVPAEDPFFADFNVSCLSFTRSSPCFRCMLGRREQMNSRSSYIDASHIYGISKEQTDSLRTFENGLLKSQEVNNLMLPPPSFNPDSDQCSHPDENQICFETGDPRSNQHPALTSLQIILFLQHNRIAKQLHGVNPHWEDEEVFQVTKRIVESQLQHVVYKEWLPEIIGANTSDAYGLTPRSSGYTSYNDSVDASMTNEFAAAAFRLGHTLVNGTFLMADSNGVEDSFEIKDKFFDPFDFYTGDLPTVLGGLIEEPFQSFDRYGTYGVTRYLFNPKGGLHGLDLFAIDLQRGRDHGARSYADYVLHYTGLNLTSFDDLHNYNLMPKETADLYADLYDNVQDIDLFSAGISEYTVPGTAVGPTFSYIVADMFQKLKFGDRFFYEHGDQVGSFTQEQLQSLRETTFAKIICENIGGGYKLRRNVFNAESTDNPTVDCADIPDIDLQLWKDEVGPGSSN
ncbi:peroxidase [Ixodes scapularis]